MNLKNSLENTKTKLRIYHKMLREKRVKKSVKRKNWWQIWGKSF